VNNGWDAQTGARDDRCAEQQTDERHQTPEPTRADDIELADVVDRHRRLSKPGANRCRKARPRRWA
jgi:hypothetical protein